jgi:dolichol kinase
MTSGLTKEELNRKLLHVLAVLIPVGIYYGPTYFEVDRIWASALIFIIMLFAFFIEFGRVKNNTFGTLFLRLFGSMMRKEERWKLTGATYLICGSAICSLVSLYEGAAACAFLSLTLFILGDAAAALVGKAFGRVKVGGKTLEGSIGCFLLCTILGGFLFPILPGFLDGWGGEWSLLAVLALSLTVTLLELIPVKFMGIVINDNLYVPAMTVVVALLLK